MRYQQLHSTIFHRGNGKSVILRGWLSSSKDQSVTLLCLDIHKFFNPTMFPNLAGSVGSNSEIYVDNIDFSRVKGQYHVYKPEDI